MLNRSTAIEIKTPKEIAAKSVSLRAGIIGAGLMGRWHAHAIKKVGGSIVGVADVDNFAARRLAARYAEAKSFSAIEELLEQDSIQVLHVCSPAATHSRIAGLAIEAGVNLIIEKPLTQTAADTENILARAAEHGVLVCPVHQFAFQDGVLKAKQWLPRIGRIVDLSATMVSAGGTGRAAEQLDQIVADILPHPLSLMQFFVPADYTRMKWMTLRPGYGELRATCEAAQVAISISISLNARPTVNALSIRGTNGTIHLDLFHGYAMIEQGNATRLRKIAHPFELSFRNLSAATINLGQRALRGEPAYPGLQRLVKSFYGAVLSRGVSPISPEDALAVAQTRDRLIKIAGLTSSS